MQGSVIKCGECGLQWVYGLVLAKLPTWTPRFRRDPIDTVLIEDGLWRGSARINRILCSSCATEVFMEAYELANRRTEYLDSKLPATEIAHT